MASPAEQGGEMRGSCEPVSVRYSKYEAIQPHLRGLFDGMQVPTEDDNCVGRKLCAGCMHGYPYGEELVGLLEAEVPLSSEALDALIIEPASSEAYFSALNSLGLTPQELKALLADLTFRRTADERATYHRRVISAEQAARELDLRPLAVLNLVVNVVWNSLGNSRTQNRITNTPILLASLDERFIRQFIRDHMYMEGDEILYQYFYGDYDISLNDGQRKDYVKSLCGVGITAIDKSIQKFRFNIAEAIRSGNVPELKDISFDHRILDCIKNSMTFYIIGSPSGTKKYQGMSILDWISDEARAYELYPKPELIEEIRNFKLALAQTNDTSKPPTG